MGGAIKPKRVVLSFFNISIGLKSLGVLRRIQASEDPWSHASLALAALESWNILCHLAVFIDLNFSRRMDECMVADIVLLVSGINIPAFNLLASLVFPSFLAVKNWHSFLLFLVAACSWLLPPAHSIVQMLVMSPVMT